MMADTGMSQSQQVSIAGSPSPESKLPQVTAWKKIARILTQHGPEAAIGVAIWVASLCWPFVIPSENLEVTWLQTLHYGFAHGWQWGRDLIFTYGPWGFALISGFDPQTYGWYIAWNCSIHVISVGLLLYFAYSLQNRGLRVLFLMFFLLMIPFIAQILRDRYYILVLALSSCALIRAERPTWLALSVFSLLAAILALSKFTLLTLNVMLITLVLFRIAQQRGWRLAVLFLLIFVAELISFWALAGQEVSLAAWQAYWKSSTEVAAGYSKAMGVEGLAAELATAGWALAAVAALYFTTVVSNRFKFFSLLTTASVGLTSFLLWKQGFARHDAHCHMFFGCVPFLTFPAWLERTGSRWARSLRTVLTLGTISACMYGFQQRAAEDHLDMRPDRLIVSSAKLMYEQAVRLIHPKAFAELKERETAEAREDWRCDRIASHIGDERVAWLKNSQGLGILNDFHIDPRGVPQSYSAYTEWLANENGRRFTTLEAPPFAVVKVETLLPDNRWPMADDGPALLELMARYRPVTNQGGYLLFEKRPPDQPSGALGNVMQEHDFSLGELVPLPNPQGVWRAFSIDLKLTLQGMLATSLLRTPTVMLQCFCADGTQHEFRIIPGLCKSWALLDPLVKEQTDFIKLVAGVPIERVTALRVVVPRDHAACFQDRARLIVRRYDPAIQVDQAVTQRLLFPALFAIPAEVRSPLYGSSRLQAASIFTLSAPGEAKLPLPAKKTRLRGAYGVLPQLQEQLRAEGGADFYVDHVNLEGKVSSLLHEHWPGTNAESRRKFDLQIPTPSAGSIVLRTTAAKSPAHSLYWADLEIE